VSTAIATVPSVTDPRELALLRAVGLDRVSAEQRELALNIAKRYELDLLLKHLVMVDGRPYITRDGLLHVAHRSGQLDGIETTDAILADGFWRASCSVYRKDMSRPFTYSGRYPENGNNKKFAPEMAVKVAEVMALRRAFDVAAPAADERWDTDLPVAEIAPRPTLADRAKAAATEVVQSTGLTKSAFVAALKANNISSQYAAEVRMRLFPDGGELNDEQRQQLFDLLLDTQPYDEPWAEQPEQPTMELTDEEKAAVVGDLR
jgi:hypothetical protein